MEVVHFISFEEWINLARMILQLATNSQNSQFDRRIVFPEVELPDAKSILARGRALASSVKVGTSSFLVDRNVSCEAEYKRLCDANSDIMIHSQIGYRDPEKTERAYHEIWQRAGERNARVDRYGICLDWSMGFRRADRKNAQKGTGLILESEDAFVELTSQAPVAAHFGDFVMGLPAALENTVAALKAGSTAIGNLGQYFTFRLPGWHDDVADTEVTLEALALAAAQPVDVLIHSNLDDGFAALFTDLACSLGAVLLEQYIVEDLIGGKMSHCYGHSFSEPAKRLAFQLALERVSNNPGTMVYGNTVSYDGDGPENYSALASYLSIDAAAQNYRPSGHAINPVPITEATRIPDIDEVVDAVAFAGRMIEHTARYSTVYDFPQAELTANKLVEGAVRFKDAVLAGLELGGIHTDNPFEMLLALRRIGANRLEEQFGPGVESKTNRHGRVPILQASTITALELSAEMKFQAVDKAQSEIIQGGKLKLCVCTTDVHEYGKILLEEVFKKFEVEVINAGVHADPDTVASIVKQQNADAIAISTYNGIALDYLRQLRTSLSEQNIDVPILMGGKTNQIPQGSNTSLPVDVSDKLVEEGALVCRKIEDMVPYLVQIAEYKQQ
jgi:methylmalonyl-CoA mutase cobalamin-binding subunit